MASAHPPGAASELDLHALRDEHEQLVSENLAYMGLLSRYARALGLCATLEPEALAERIVEALCLETHAQGGLLWMARDEGHEELALATVRGVVKAADEWETLSARALPAGLEALADSDRTAFIGPSSMQGGAEGLWVAFRHAGRLLAVARVSDRLDAARFDPRDMATAEQFAEVAALALANALRFRALERRSLRDPRTHAYTPAFFEGVVANELEKAHRFGRNFALVDVALVGLESVRARDGEAAASLFADGFAKRLQQALRGTDVCAIEGEGRFRVLLSETDALGAAVLKRRIRSLVEPWIQRPGVGAPVATLQIAVATFPQDGTRLESLRRCLARRLDEETRSAARMLERESRSFADSRRWLLRDARPVPPQLTEQAVRFALEELRRRAHERALVFLSPGAELRPMVLDELSRMRGRPMRADILLLSDADDIDLRGLPVTRIDVRGAGTRAPFLVYLGEVPAYACLRGREGDGAPVFHSSDRVLVEHLAFELQRDLGLPVAA